MGDARAIGGRGWGVLMAAATSHFVAAASPLCSPPLLHMANAARIWILPLDALALGLGPHSFFIGRLLRLSFVRSRRIF